MKKVPRRVQTFRRAVSPNPHGLEAQVLLLGWGLRTAGRHHPYPYKTVLHNSQENGVFLGKQFSFLFLTLEFAVRFLSVTSSYAISCTVYCVV